MDKRNTDLGDKFTTEGMEALRENNTTPSFKKITSCQNCGLPGHLHRPVRGGMPGVCSCSPAHSERSEDCTAGTTPAIAEAMPR